MSCKLIIPKNYESLLTVRESEKALKAIKDYFEKTLAEALHLERVSAPLFVKKGTGINDDLNGVERPVSFTIKADNDSDVEIVHSLAKWKRMALARYGFSAGEGLYTDMNAIRRDEELDNLHSLYVDQWDWEKIIPKEARNIKTLKQTVTLIFESLKQTEKQVCSLYPALTPMLPESIYFIHSQELEDLYPTLSPKEREDAICKEKRAVFIMGIGGTLTSGQPHDGRAPDYDDWNLNGDILLWNPILDRAFEISSMGIRVDEEALTHQLTVAQCEYRKNLPFHSMLLHGELPYTMGGGIGQSRICMFFLQKAHIGEVQSSIWTDEMITACQQNNIFLL